MSDHQHIKPPRLWLSFLRWFCREDLLEDVEGDMLELFYAQAEQSPKVARRHFRNEVFQLIRPRIWKSFKVSTFNIMLFKNYLKTAWRNANMYRAYSFVNLFGLIVGISASVCIYLWIADEEAKDQFHTNKDRLVTVKRNLAQSDGLTVTTSNIPHPVAELLRTEYPEVIEVTEVSWSMESLLDMEESSTMERGRFVSENFFGVFSFPLVAGSEVNNSELSGILISKVLADKYIVKGEQYVDLIGRSIRYENEETLVIKGVFDSKPKVSSLELDWVRPAKGFIDQAEWMKSWENGAFSIHALLVDGEKIADVNARITNEIESHTERANGETLWVQLFSEVYLNGDYEAGKVVGGKIRYVNIMKVVAALILMMACINYMNLSTARSAQRSKEIGLRKVMGANRSMISRQFLFEAFLYITSATLVSLVLVFAILPLFNQLIDRQLSISFFDLTFWFYLVAMVVITAVLSGSYPAVRLAAVNLVQAMKGGGNKDKKATFIRKGLVVFQVGVSFVLLIGSIMIHDQIQYLLTRDTGMNREQVLAVWMEGALEGQFDTYRQELMGVPGVVEVAGLSGNPVDYGRSTSSAKWEGQDPNTPYEVGVMVVSDNFLQVMDIKIGESGLFDPAHQSDSLGYIINKAAANLMGYSEPIDKRLSVWGMNGRIVGLVDDFNVSSLHEEVKPQIILVRNEYVEMALIKVMPNASNIIEKIDELTRTMNPEFPVDMVWLDESFKGQYETEMVMGKLSNLFMIVSLIIACLGLLGLSAYSIEKRTKEIGIRKVHGASSWHLMMLLTREYVWLIVIAFVMAIPISYLQGLEWLNSFAYHIDLNAGIFIFSALILLAVGCATVSYKSYQACQRNPVDTLRSE